VRAPAAPAQPVPMQRVSDTDDEADDYADTDPSALSDFREPLDPYGNWVEDANYGTVWVPNATVVGADFAPYQTSGHWALDDNEDWMWVSDYDWGYIPFHYGRWVWIAGNGWGWIPGRVYAPAWVTWRVGDGGYMGWAPMPPTWYWSGGVAVGLWVQPYAAFCFVPSGYIFNEHVYNYVVRDQATVRAAAAGTRPYKPASPSVGGSGGGSHPTSAHGFRPASPRLTEAGVPPTSAPKVHTSADPRARNFATRSSTAAARRSFAPGGGRGMSAVPSHRGVANSNPWQTHQPSFDRSAPVYDRGARPFDRSAPVYDRGAGSSAFSRSPGPVLRTPTRDIPSAPRYYGSPGYSAARPSYPSAPSFRPSAPSFQPSAPSFRPSAPSFRPSAPSFRPSAPAHFGGGGGGGRHR
jgi:hypothetical protein